MAEIVRGDEPRGEQRARHARRLANRGRIAVLLIFALALAAGIGGYYWWRDYIRSPQATLTRLAQAAQNGDWPGVQENLDVEHVSNDIAQAALKQGMQDRASELGQLGVLGDEITKGIADTMQPRIAEEVRLQMQEQVERRDGDAQGFFGALVVANKPKSVKIRGSMAFVTVVVPYEGRQIELELRMKQRMDETWQVVELRNADEIVRQFSS